MSITTATYRPAGSPTPCPRCDKFCQPPAGWRCNHRGLVRSFRRKRGSHHLVQSREACPWYQGDQAPQPAPRRAAQERRPYVD